MTRFAFSSAVYARHEGAILLVHHKRMDQWLPVGGEIEAGETPQQAAMRELREETGLTQASIGLSSFGSAPPPDSDFLERLLSMPGNSITQLDSGRPIGFLGYEEHDAGSKGWHGTFSFLFDVPSRDVKLCDEHHAFAWVDGWASALAERYPMPPNVKHYLTVIRHTMRLERAREATR